MSTSTSGVSPASLAAQLEALNEEQHASDLHADKQTVHVETAEIKFHKDQQALADERAQEAADDSSFWDDVASVAKDVAAAGAIAGAAFSGGSTLIVAGAILGGGLTLSSDVAGRLGASKDVCLGLELAGAGFSLVAGGASLFVANAHEVSEVSAVGGLASKSVGGGATVVQGGAHFAQRAAGSREENSKADSVEAGTMADHAKQLVDDAFTRMHHDQSDAKFRSNVATSLESMDQETNLALTNAIRG